MAVGTNYYIRVLLGAFIYPADMPLQWCAHLWGCLWGIGGCYPSRTPSLVLAPGWWPGGLIPYLKDVGYRYRGVQPDGDRDCYLPHILPHIRPHIAGRGVVVEAPRACPRRRPSHWGPSLAPLPHPRTHPAHPSRSRRSVEAPFRGPPLVRMSRGRPPMRGPGGAPHGRCQPERWAGSGSVVGQGRQQGALIGGGAWGGHRGARRGGSGGGACPGSCVGWCVSGRVGEERRGRLGQPSSIGGR